MMINRYFHGLLGKLAAIGYTAGAVCLVLAVAFSALASAGPAQAQGVGNCLTAGDGQVWEKHDSGGSHTFTAPSGWVYVEAGFKAGDQCFSTTTDGVISVEGQDCYSVSGLGTGSVTIRQLVSNSVCKDISHTEAIREQQPTNTPTNTPTSTSLPSHTPTETPTNTPTDTSAPTNTPTETNTPDPDETPTDTPTPSDTPIPTDTPTDTPSPSETNTPDPDETPTDTPTPSDTPIPTDTPETTAGPPQLIDPKGDSLLTDNDGNGQPSPGDVLLYSTTITNVGEAAAEGVTFTDTPDSNTSLIDGSVTTTQGTVDSGNSPGDTTVEVNIGTIEPGDAVTVTFQVTIDSGLPQSVDQVENQGLVSGDNFDDSPTDDPDTDDPDDPTVTLLVHPAASPTPGGPTPTEPPAEGTPSTVLIPVTGVERTVAHTNAGPSGILYNLGLSLLGISLVLHGLSFSRRKDN